MPETTPTSTPVSQEECLSRDVALANAFKLLGKRWTAVVLGSLSAGSAGFREIARLCDGISDSVLSDRLVELTGAALITRDVDPGPPVSVSYALTSRGEALMPALEQISLWAHQHLGDR